MNKKLQQKIKLEFETFIQKLRAGNLSPLLNLALYACVYVFAFVAAGSFLRLFDRFDGSIGITDILNNIRSGSNDALEFALILVPITLLLLIVWLYLLRKKMMQHKITLAHSLPTTIWSWFVPLVNFVLPYRILQSTKKEIQDFNQTTATQTSSDLLGWVFFILGNSLLLLSSFIDRGSLMHILHVLAGIILAIGYDRLRKMIASMEIVFAPTK
ncbi:MAG: DUF4328 domain-containing protein, partial [Bacteroidia bacterium]